MNTFTKLCSVVLLILTALACQKSGDLLVYPQQADKMTAQVVQRWHEELIHMIKVTPGYTVPVSSRALAYIGIAMYEASLPANPHFRSLTESIDGFTVTPKFRPGEFIDVEIAINAAIARTALHFFKAASQIEIQRIHTLQNDIHRTLANNYEDRRIVDRSFAYGTAVAESLIQLDEIDELGNESYLKNYLVSWQPVQSSGNWQPTPPYFLPAVFPNWYQVNSLGFPARNIEASLPYPFETTPGTTLYEEAMEIYQMSLSLNEEQKLMAEFWDDQMPNTTLGSPARWLTIFMNLAREQKLHLEKTIEIYCKMALSNYNGTIATWQAKYRFNRMRPITYIRQYIDPNFQEYMSSSPTPEYVSEHALIAFSSAAILTHYFGNQHFIDRCHEQTLGSRSFNSFMSAADECAISRMYAGTHFKHSIKEAERMGKFCADQTLKNIKWRY